MRKPLLIAATVTTLALAVTPLAGAAVAGGQQHEQQGHHHGHRGHHPMSGPLPGGYKHLVVIYEENHSFDNLYGDWGSVDGQQVRGLSDPAVAWRQDGWPESPRSPCRRWPTRRRAPRS